MERFKGIGLLCIFWASTICGDGGVEYLSVHEIIREFFDNYTRQITVVEFLGEREQSSAFILRDKKIWWYLVVPCNRCIESVQTVRSSNFCNVAIMSPQVAVERLLDTLGRCEMPDCVIFKQDSLITEQLVRELLLIADYCIVVGDDTVATRLKPFEDKRILCKRAVDGRFVLIYKTNKPGLDIARWMCKFQPRTGYLKYPVESSFDHKEMVKRGVRSKWLPGINLMTFIAMRGIYPTHDHIREQIKQMKRIDHNDLVIGNMLLQGKRVVPIDFNDNRRNGKKRRCIKAALSLFKKHHRMLFSDPEQALNQYHASIVGKGGR